MKRYVGVDVGGTKIEGVLVNENLRVLKRLRIRTEAEKSLSHVLANVESMVNQLRTGRVSGIGIGTPGFEDPEGRMELVPNIPQFEKFRLKQELERRLERRIFLENDANCFILAEHRAGAAVNMKNVLGITLGTGIGGGAVLDGKLFRGKDGGAAHFGQMIIHPAADGLSHQDLESWCGGKSIEKRFLKRTGKRLTATQIFESRSPAARKLVEEVYHRLGIGFANLIAAFNPEGMVLGGSISRDVDSARLKREIDRHGQRPLTKGVKILKNKLGTSAGVFGAACIAMHE